MKTFETFYFIGYSFDPRSLKASFSYSFDHEVNFTETIDFACPWFRPISVIDAEIMKTLLFHLSLAVGISYYKLYPTKNLILEHWSLNEDQKSFWKTFYLQGLGEFLFRNNISPQELINFINGKTSSPKKQFSINSTTPLIALWWGKDSFCLLYTSDAADE